MSDYVELERRAKEALERSERATEPPWGVELKSHVPPIVVQLDIPRRREVFFHGPSFLEHDADFVIHARDDVPDLAQVVLELIARVEELEKALDNARWAKRVNAEHIETQRQRILELEQRLGGEARAKEGRDG